MSRWGGVHLAEVSHVDLVNGACGKDGCVARKGHEMSAPELYRWTAVIMAVTALLVSAVTVTALAAARW